jgi:hypothetical protein
MLCAERFTCSEYHKFESVYFFLNTSSILKLRYIFISNIFSCHTRHCAWSLETLSPPWERQWSHDIRNDLHRPRALVVAGMLIFIRLQSPEGPLAFCL